nr:group II intron maturase-specific domain-containing protein [Thalassoroseus pseudoceratinae]
MNACVRTGLISPPVALSPKLRGYEQERHTRPVRVRATVNVAAKSVHQFKQRIRAITGRSRGISMERRLSELRSYVRGWMGYFGLVS